VFTYRDVRAWLGDPFLTPPLGPPVEQLAFAWQVLDSMGNLTRKRLPNPSK
jgi:hypothetical protein